LKVGVNVNPNINAGVNVQAEGPEKAVAIEAPKSSNRFNHQYDVKSYCRTGLCTFTTKTNNLTETKIERNGLLRFENENYDDFDNFIRSSNYKIIVCITIYDEDPEKLEPNFEGMVANVITLNRKFGLTADDILVVVVADGLKTLSPEYKEIFFNDRMLTKDPNALDAVHDINEHYMHLFIAEYSKKIEGIDLSNIQLLFAVKEGHFGRKNSIHHFLNGIAYDLTTRCGMLKTDEISDKIYFMIQKPQIKLHRHAIYKFLLTFKYHPEAASLGGQVEINEADVGILSIEAAQMLENKLEHIYERPCENLFNFLMITSPSIFLYKYKHVINIGFQNTYFFENVVDRFNSLFTTNANLDEERTINLDLACAKDKVGLIKYVPDAIAYFPGHPTLSSYLEDKKITNLSLYCHWVDYFLPKSIAASDKEVFHKFTMIIFSIYWCLNIAVKLLNLGYSYTIVFVIHYFAYGREATDWILTIYGIVVFIFMIVSVAKVQIEGLRYLFYVAIILLKVFSVFTFISGCIAINNIRVDPVMYADLFYLAPSVIIPLMTVLSFGIPFVLKIMQFWKTFLRGLFAYSIINLLSITLVPIYTFANFDDFDYDRSVLEFDERIEKKNRYSFYRIIIYLAYIFCNGFLVFLYNQIGFSNYLRVKYIEHLLYFIVWLYFIKIIFTTFDIIRFMCKEKNGRKEGKTAVKDEYAQLNIRVLGGPEFKNIKWKTKGFVNIGTNNIQNKVNLVTPHRIVDKLNISGDPVSMRSYNEISTNVNGYQNIGIDESTVVFEKKEKAGLFNASLNRDDEYNNNHDNFNNHNNNAIQLKVQINANNLQDDGEHTGEVVFDDLPKYEVKEPPVKVIASPSPKSKKFVKKEEELEIIVEKPTLEESNYASNVYNSEKKQSKKKFDDERQIIMEDNNDWDREEVVEKHQSWQIDEPKVFKPNVEVYDSNDSMSKYVAQQQERLYYENLKEDGELRIDGLAKVGIKQVYDKVKHDNYNYEYENHKSNNNNDYNYQGNVNVKASVQPIPPISVSVNQFEQSPKPTKKTKKSKSPEKEFSNTIKLDANVELDNQGAKTPKSSRRRSSSKSPDATKAKTPKRGSIVQDSSLLSPNR